MEINSKVKVRGMVENWLSNVETSMFDVMRNCLWTAMDKWTELQDKFIDWTFSNPGQIVLVVVSNF